MSTKLKDYIYAEDVGCIELIFLWELLRSASSFQTLKLGRTCSTRYFLNLANIVKLHWFAKNVMFGFNFEISLTWSPSPLMEPEYEFWLKGQALKLLIFWQVFQSILKLVHVIYFKPNFAIKQFYFRLFQSQPFLIESRRADFGKR